MALDLHVSLARTLSTDAEVIEVDEGKLGVVIAEGHSFDVRARHDAAAAAVG